MAATHIYHWKHGWIPLDHAAALSKSKGSEHGARQALAAAHAAGHAHASVVAGEFGGGTHVRGLQPVALGHLDRKRHIVAAFNPDSRRFALHDPQGREGLVEQPISASIPEHLAAHFHDNKYKVSRVINTKDGHRVVVEAPNGDLKSFHADGTDIHSVEPIGHASIGTKHTYKPIGVSDALGPDNRSESERLRDAFLTKHSRGGNVGLRDRVTAKVKQAYRDEHGHTVLIEPNLTKAQTQELLASVHHVTSAAAANIAHPIRIHIPSGDSQFRSGRVLGYVVRGTPTVHLSPKLVAGDAEQPKDSPHFMPAHGKTSTLRYTIAHEIGHVIDHSHAHTTRAMHATPSGMQIPGDLPAISAELHREYRSDLSRYGKTNVHEGYAEAFAQWVTDRAANDPAAAAYAQRYGWK